jgi:hypothetical protein
MESEARGNFLGSGVAEVGDGWDGTGRGGEEEEWVVKWGVTLK